jgi:hypothetical protein
MIIKSEKWQVKVFVVHYLINSGQQSALSDQLFEKIVLVHVVRLLIHLAGNAYGFI